MRDYILGQLSDRFNRRLDQCRFLLDLCEGDLFRYIELEMRLKNLMLPYVPGDKEELINILLKELSSDEIWFNLIPS